VKKLIVSSNYQANTYNYSKALKNSNYAKEVSASRSDSNVSISQNGSNAVDRIHSVAARYDVNDISQKERVEMAGELMESGLISSGVGLHLVAPRGMNEKPNDRSDLLNGMKESLIVDNSPLNSEHMKNKLKAISILEELKSLRSR